MYSIIKQYHHAFIKDPRHITAYMVVYKNIVDQSESSKIELDQALLYVVYEIGISSFTKGRLHFFQQSQSFVYKIVHKVKKS